MLNTWAAERKLIYTILFAGIAVIVIGIPLFFFFYVPPSCTDGKRNQDETGVDCGGSCRNLCQVAELPPVVIWAQKFLVTTGVYSVAAYIENPNPLAEALAVPYRFTILDDKGLPIVSREGTTFIPAHKKFAVFESGLSVGERIPGNVHFEFTQKPYWTRRVKAESELSITDKTLTNEGTNPRIEAHITNQSVDPAGAVSVVAIVYESNGNAIAVSKTVVEHLDKNETAPLVFTWPMAFPERVASCEVPTDVMLVIDRSGSMDDDGVTPPQPLTDVKNAALSFISRLKSTDRAGLVSFANEASVPLDATLTNNFSQIEKAIRAISIIAPGDTQNTNISDGILKADQELQSDRYTDGATKAIVLLTDGVATRPEKTGDESYPERVALTSASLARDHGDEIYTIGLGTKVNTSFLGQLATNDNYFFSAVTTKSLTTIYKQIATALCKKGPTKIELIPIIEPR